MNQPPEHSDHLVEAPAPTTKRGPGCGCLGWAVFAVLFLVFAGGPLGVWRPLIVLPVVFIVIGAALWTLFAALRSGRARRGRYDPRNADWHPASLAQDEPRRPAPAGGPPSGAVAPAPAEMSAGAVAPAAETGAGAVAPAVEMAAGAPADPAPPPAPPTGGPASEPSGAPAVAEGSADVTPADLPGAPQAPEAPEAPASPWA